MDSISKCTFFGSHNSFANFKDNWSKGSQHLNVKEQLDFGVRCFMFEIHNYDYGWIRGNKHVALMKTSNIWRNIFSNHFGKPKKLKSILYEMKVWGVKRNDIIFIILKDHVKNVNKINKILEELQLTTLCYYHLAGDPWPRVDKLYEQRKKFIFFSTQEYERNNYYINSFYNNIISNRWDVYPQVCIEHIQKDDARLVLLNNFFPKSESKSSYKRRYDSINSVKNTKYRIDEMIKLTGKMPNFIIFNFTSHGDYFYARRRRENDTEEYTGL